MGDVAEVLDRVTTVPEVCDHVLPDVTPVEAEESKVTVVPGSMLDWSDPALIVAGVVAVVAGTKMISALELVACAALNVAVAGPAVPGEANALWARYVPWLSVLL